MRPYRPSNGTEGDCFIAEWCVNCVRFNGRRRDEDEEFPPGCDILNRTFAFSIGDDLYPEEWVYDEANDPMCTAFKHIEDREEEQYRCPETPDMFGP